MEALPEKERSVVSAIQDTQMQRAEDLLRGLILYDQMTGLAKPEKMAAK